jgi:hypothetical protein
MFDWKPPDPRLVAIVRRIRAAIQRRVGGVQRGTGPRMTGDAISPVRASDDADPEASAVRGRGPEEPA